MKSNLIFVSGLVLLSTVMFLAGRKYEHIQKDVTCNKCTKGQLCGNALEAINRLRDYQIELHNDTVWLYDGDRQVGTYISNWLNQMDTILLEDNQ